MSDCWPSSGGVVVFDYNAWLARFPEFGVGTPPGNPPNPVPFATAQQYFAEACVIVNNGACSRVADLNDRTVILNLLTAHIAFMNWGANGQPPTGIVGRVAAAQEGTVQVRTEYDAPATAAWFTQTKYGAQAYQLLAPYRTARYRVRRRRWSQYGGGPSWPFYPGY